MQSSTASTFTLNNTVAATVNYVRVAHSVAAAVGITANNSVDLSGDNTNWSFGAVSWLTGGSTDANLGSNWSSGVVPGVNDVVTVPTGGNQPVQTAVLSVKGLTIQGSWSNGVYGLTVGSGGLSNTGTFTYTGVGILTGMPASMGGTFIYSGGTVGMVAGVTTYANLSVSGGTITAITATVSGNLSVSGGSLAVPNGVTLTIGGNSTINPGGTLTATGNGTISVAGELEQQRDVHRRGHEHGELHGSGGAHDLGCDELLQPRATRWGARR